MSCECKSEFNYFAWIMLFIITILSMGAYNLLKKIEVNTRRAVKTEHIEDNNE